MLRLGVHEQGITEILGIAEHVVSVSAAAAGLRLRPDGPSFSSDGIAALVTLPDTPSAEARATWDEIASWSRSALGTAHVPAFWRAFAGRPRLLAAIWAKHRLVLSSGELTEDAKVAVALAVAMNERSEYWTGYFTELGRRSGVFDDEVIMEIAAATLHYNSFNTISHGMMLDAPVHDLVAADSRSPIGRSDPAKDDSSRCMRSARPRSVYADESTELPRSAT